MYTNYIYSSKSFFIEGEGVSISAKSTAEAKSSTMQSSFLAFAASFLQPVPYKLV